MRQKTSLVLGLLWLAITACESAEPLPGGEGPDASVSRADANGPTDASAQPDAGGLADATSGQTDASGQADAGGQADAASSTVAAEQWTLSGTVYLPANEAASTLRIVLTESRVAYSASSYASDVVTLTPMGSPLTATFTLQVDSTRLGVLPGATNVALLVFDDVNLDGVNNISEGARSMGTTDPSSGVWGDGTDYSIIPGFQRWTRGTSGQDSNGPWMIDQTGWYYQHGCKHSSCRRLVTENAVLSGTKVEYSRSSNTQAIVPR